MGLFPRKVEQVTSKLCDTSSTYAQLLARDTALRERRAAIPVEMRRLIAARQADAPPVSQAEAARQARVAGLIGSARVAVPKAEATSESGVADGQLGGLQREYDDIGVALEQLEEMLRDERLKASMLVCAQIEDQHSKLVSRTAAALKELHRSLVEYQIFADELNRDGVAWTKLGPAFLPQIGNPRQRDCAIGEWFRNAVSDGHIAKGDVPMELR